MAHITLLSSVLSFFLITISADVQDIMVIEYYTDIQLFPLQDVLYTTWCFVFKNLQTTQKISIRTENKIAVFPEISLIKKETDVNLKFTTKQNDTTKILTIFLNEKMDPGLYIMNVTIVTFFRFGFNEVYSDYIHEKEVLWLFSTHFQPIWVEKIIPFWVRPKEDTSWLDMPTFRISILHFTHYSVLTNMPIRGEWLYVNKLGMDTKWTYFDTTFPMSPYQLSIVVTNFTHIIIDKDDVVSMWCRNRSASFLQFALTIAKNITTYFHFSRKWLHWRFSTKVNLIVIPKIQSFSGEKFPERNDSLVHPGIIIVNEDDITYDKENDTVGRKYNVIRLLGYKLTQEFYEWIVNPYFDPNTWLSKGFAMFIATYKLNEIWPNLRMIDLFVVQVQHECLDFDVENSTIPIEIIDNMKASVLLRMLLHTYNITEAFWKAVYTFTYESIIHNKKDHLKVFWRALNDAYDGTYDIEGLMHSLVEGKGYPVLTVERNYNTPTSTIKLLFKDLHSKKKNRTIPLTAATPRYLGFTQTAPREWVNLSDRHLTLNLSYKEDSWIIFNMQQTGYYRVNYDDENWARISTYLNKEDYWRIHVLNRAQLIDDAFHFMLLGNLTADIFWQLAQYLKRETDYIAWYPMFKAIEYMSTGFHFYEELYLIKTNLTEMLNTLLGNTLYVKQPTDNDLTEPLRQEAAQWACFFKSYYCVDTSFNLLKYHFEYHMFRFSPWWKKWAYCYGLIEADNITWHQTLNEIKGNDNDKILYLVTCPNYLVKLKNYTSTTYTNDDVKLHLTPSTILQIELRHFVYAVVESVKSDKKYNDDKTYRNNTNFKKLLNNFVDIKPRQLKLSTAMLILFNNIYFDEHLYDVWNGLVFEDIPLFHKAEKLRARIDQIKKHDQLFARIKPQN